MNIPPLNELHIHESPALRAIAETFDVTSALVPSLAFRMVELAREADGIGLAGPQIGLPYRVIVCKLQEQWSFLMNPRIVWISHHRVGAAEGCLSLPGIKVNVVRPCAVRVAHTMADRSIRSIEACDLAARVLQHEIDHLDGILITDRGLSGGIEPVGGG